MTSKQNGTHKNRQAKPGPTIQPHVELTDAQLQQIVGGNRPQLDPMGPPWREMPQGPPNKPSGLPT
jgi:hypothetical protein